jgi:hypothetical protein
MSATMTDAVICPGQKQTFVGATGTPFVLRLLFTVCWEDACPNTEAFYATTPPLSTLDGIDFMNAAALVALNNPRAVSAVYLTYHAVELLQPSEFTSRVQPRLLNLTEPTPAVAA